jgi:hypothetical protein
VGRGAAWPAAAATAVQAGDAQDVGSGTLAWSVWGQRPSMWGRPSAS